MSYLENLRKTLKEGSETVIKTTEKFAEKIREFGEEGVELSRELIAEISDKTSDITRLNKLKLEVSTQRKELDSEYQGLGDLSLKMYKLKDMSKYKEKFLEQVKKIDTVKNLFETKQAELENFQKSHSVSHVVNKLSEELAEGEAIINQVIVSHESDVINKSLKEILLPKEALISAIKREKDVIIPDGNTKLLAGDTVTIIGKQADVERVMKRLSAK